MANPLGCLLQSKVHRAAAVAALVLFGAPGAVANSHEPYRETDGATVTQAQALACLQLDMFVVFQGTDNPRCFWGWNGTTFTYNTADKSPDNPSSDGARVDGATPTRVNAGWSDADIFEHGDSCLAAGDQAIFRYHVGGLWGEWYCVDLPDPGASNPPDPPATPAYKQTDGTVVSVSDALACLQLDMFVVFQGTDNPRCFWGWNGTTFTYDAADKSADNPSSDGARVDGATPTRVNAGWSDADIFEHGDSCLAAGDQAIFRYHVGGRWGEWYCVDLPDPGASNPPDPPATPAYKETDGTVVTVAEALKCLHLDMFVTVEPSINGDAYTCWWGWNGTTFTYDARDKSADNPSSDGARVDGATPTAEYLGWNSTDIFTHADACVDGGDEAVFRYHVGGRWGERYCIDLPAASYVDVATGYNHACALDDTGGVICWGARILDMATRAASAYTRSFVEISAGQDHHCGRDGSGNVRCFGEAAHGEIATPSGTFTAIASGYRFNCGVRTDGDLHCWGDDRADKTDAPDGTYTAVAAGLDHACALDDEGGIECWGRNSLNQADPPDGTYTAITAGKYHACAIDDDGSIDCWGLNTDGQADAPSGAYVAVSAGAAHTCALDGDGSISCWGGNDDGQADAPAGQYDAVFADDEYTCGIRANGTLTCWGYVPWALDDPWEP